MTIFSYIQNQKSWLKHTMALQDAEDVIQDVFEIVLRRKEFFESKSLNEQEKLVWTIIKNKRIDILRSNSCNFHRTVEIPLLSTKPSVYSLLELQEVKKRIEDIQLQYILDYAIGLTEDEIAIKYHLSQKSIRSSISRGRKRLRA